jgi:hypothetical protein
MSSVPSQSHFQSNPGAAVLLLIPIHGQLSLSAAECPKGMARGFGRRLRLVTIYGQMTGDGQFSRLIRERGNKKSSVGPVACFDERTGPSTCRIMTDRAAFHVI